MDNSAQNPTDPNAVPQVPPMDDGTTPPPVQGGLTNTDTLPPQAPPTPPSTPLSADQLYAPSTPADFPPASPATPPPTPNIPTPPQESLGQVDQVQDLSSLNEQVNQIPPTSYDQGTQAPYQNPTPPPPSNPSQMNYQEQYPQTPPSPYGQVPPLEPQTDYSQAGQGYGQAPAPAAPPPPLPVKKSSSKGFLLGGLLALIVIGGLFAVFMIANKKTSSDDIPLPSNTKPTATPQAIATQAPTEAPVPTNLASPTPVPTPKTSESFINTTYRYEFNYPLGLTAPKKVEPDPLRFPKALEVVNLSLSKDPSSSTSANFIVWDKVDDVPKYITDGQNQFVKVNVYTTNRFTIKKPDNIEETHYLTQKFDNTYDIMLQTASGKISDPAFEKILDSFTFIENMGDVSAANQNTSTNSAKGATDPSASAKPSPTISL